MIKLDKREIKFNIKRKILELIKLVYEKRYKRKVPTMV